MEGWLKIHRKFTDWGWYKKEGMVLLFIHLLLTANFEDKEWEGVIIKRGQVIIGRTKLSKATGLSEQNIRSCLTRLKSTSEITIKSTNRFSVATICKYEEYQEVPIEANQLINQQTNQRLTTTKEVKKKEKKEKVKKESLKFPEKLDSPKFRKVWNEEWIKFRKEMKFTTTIGAQKRNLSTVNKLSNGNPTIAIKIIRSSIEQNYQGLFPLKNNTAQKRKPSQGTRAEKPDFANAETIEMKAHNANK